MTSLDFQLIYGSIMFIRFIRLSLLQVCRRIDSAPDGTSVLQRIFEGVSVYYNYTGKTDCFDLHDDPHGMSGWDWQVGNLNDAELLNLCYENLPLMFINFLWQSLHYYEVILLMSCFHLLLHLAGLH